MYQSLLQPKNIALKTVKVSDFSTVYYFGYQGYLAMSRDIFIVKTGKGKHYWYSSGWKPDMLFNIPQCTGHFLMGKKFECQ